jgi:hypothetical protein
MMRCGGTLRDGRYLANPVDNERILFVAVYNALYSCCWLIASDLDFDILLERIRRGGDLPTDHELIVRRNTVDEAAKLAAKELGILHPGPKRTGTM